MHPEVATRDCADCHTYLYDESGIRLIDKRVNRPVLRPPTKPVQCRLSSGCPRGCFRHPSKPDVDNSLTRHNEMAYHHYRACKATGVWPIADDGDVDETVKRNALTISEAERISAWIAEEKNTMLLEQNLESTQMMIRALTSR